MKYLNKNFRRKYISYDKMKELEEKYPSTKEGFHPVPTEWQKEMDEVHYFSNLSIAVELQKEVNESKYLFSYNCKETRGIIDYFENKNHLIQVLIVAYSHYYYIGAFAVSNLKNITLN